MKLKKLFIFIFLSFFSLSLNAISLENKILFKINEEIVTTQDIADEIKYLSILNRNILSLEREKILEIAKNSIIKQKIRKIEIFKNFKGVEIKDDYLNEMVKKTYLNLDIKTLSEFQNFLKNEKLDLEIIKNNLKINLLWNEYIVFKYRDKIKINRENLKSQIKKTNIDRKAYLLSEIVFNVEKEENFNLLLDEITKSIKVDGFENTALKFSISNSANQGGRLGWIEENVLSKNIIKQINSIKIGDYTKPIKIPSGFIILKINEIKKIKTKIDLEKELEKIVMKKTNEQFKNYSNIYFNKIKKEFYINEL